MATTARQWAQALRRLGHASDPERVAAAFVALCTTTNRMHELPHVVRHLELMAEDERRASSVRIRAAHPLDGSTTGRIAAFVGAATHDHVELERDPKVIGGFVAEYRGMIYDASLARQLERLQASLMNSHA